LFPQFVAEILSYPELYLGKQLRVATDSLSLREMAEIFSQVTGLKAQAVELNQEEYKKSYPGEILEPASLNPEDVPAN